MTDDHDLVLGSNVFVDGEWWGPAYDRIDPPSEVRAKITNEGAWITRAEHDFRLERAERSRTCDVCGRPANLSPLGITNTETGHGYCAEHEAEATGLHGSMIEEARRVLTDAEIAKLEPGDDEEPT